VINWENEGSCTHASGNFVNTICWKVYVMSFHHRAKIQDYIHCVSKMTHVLVNTLPVVETRRWSVIVWLGSLWSQLAARLCWWNQVALERHSQAVTVSKQRVIERGISVRRAHDTNIRMNLWSSVSSCCMSGVKKLCWYLIPTRTFCILKTSSQTKTLHFHTWYRYLRCSSCHIFKIQSPESF